MGMDIPLEAVKQQIASAIDVVVHLGRMRDKTRKVLEIVELDGIEDGEIKMHPLYRFCESGENESGMVIGELVKKGELKFVQKLHAASVAL